MPDPEPVRAAGGVVWRPAARGGVEVAVVHRPRYDDWSLPKGKLEAGESWVAAAVREVREETGLEVTVGRRLGETRYPVVQDGVARRKEVRWWSMCAEGGAFAAGDEVDALRWLAPDDAAALLDRDHEPLERFVAGPRETTTVLLVRHGRAGSRRAWSGDDDARPLDDVGAAQARALAELLPSYRPVRLLAAPLERCRATLEPLGRRCGLPVEPEPTLSARDSADDPDRVLERLDALVALGGTTVACSQGEVVPALVGRLGERAGLDLGGVRAAKGSAWVLSFSGGDLIDADHLPPLVDATG